jgi:hypothetical protein
MITSTCQNCGYSKEIEPDSQPANPGYCGNCPPWKCDQCGEACSRADLCACWITFDGMALADIKALFAADTSDGPALSLDRPATKGGAQ